MKPDLPGPHDADPSLHLFMEQLAAPLRYLRGLEVDVPPGLAAAAGDGAGAEAPGRPGAGGGSLLRKLERTLGCAPAVDLPGAAGEQGGGPAGDERYSVEGELGSGGMGKVLLVYDQDLRRRVAMKVLREDLRDARAVARFVEEAQATGQLEHPNIAPVYDIGVDRGGRVFFTMKLVRGRNLQEIVRDISIGRLEVRRHYTLTRLIQIIQQASMGVHYAHVRGVIHRDLKPHNIMVGDFGEVLVMDWGLAKISSRQWEADESRDPVESQARESGQLTVEGTIQGTLAYMAPEQARGWADDIDERTDVFGLGAILYEILTYRPLYEGRHAREILEKAGAGEITPPHERAPRNRIPPSLEEICLKALAPAKEDRYSDAKAFHEALQVYLDGTAETRRRSGEAAQLVRQGKEKLRKYRHLEEREVELRRQGKEELSRLQPHDPAEEKSAGWRLEDEAARVRHERIGAFNEATSYLHAAINIDESCTAAKEALADLYWDRFLEAEREGRADDTIIYRGLVERYQQGKFTAMLEGKGSLQLQSDPPGAQATVSRVVERGRRLALIETQPCGVTPLRLELPMGHYLLRLERPGFRETLYPVLIERCGRVTARVRLFPDEAIGEGFVHIPAGEVGIGGDTLASGSLEASRRYVGDVFVGKFPVTFREYCRFLDAMRGAGEADLEQWLPATEKEGVCVVLGPDGRYRPLTEKLVDTPTRDRYPEGFEWELPVFAVSWFAARRYCEWFAHETGRRARLLRDIEWEKAARGVARLAYPWGNSFDWSFTKGGRSRSEYPQPEPVGTFEADCSIYGVRDLAGLVREWCEDWFIDGDWRLTRGGCWSSGHENTFRGAFRTGARPVMKSSGIGFRVAVEP